MLRTLSDEEYSKAIGMIINVVKEMDLNVVSKRVNSIRDVVTLHIPREYDYVSYYVSSKSQDETDSTRIRK